MKKAHGVSYSLRVLAGRATQRTDMIVQDVHWSMGGSRRFRAYKRDGFFLEQRRA